MNYYNENDPFAAAWLRTLIAEGHIPEGRVDERSIEDVKPSDLNGYDQWHFFAGIGGWPLALRYAGWPDKRHVATGSCPCPPFSTANSKKARCPRCGGKSPIPCPVRTGFFICTDCEHAWFADGRHLGPEFFRLIRDFGFPVVFGEQVAGKDGEIWFSGIRASLGRIGYGAWASDLCAAGVSAPQRRQRLFWMAHANGAEFQRIPHAGAEPIHDPMSGTGELADADGQRRVGQHTLLRADEAGRISSDLPQTAGSGADCGMGDADKSRSQGRGGKFFECPHQWPVGTPNLVVLCTDGKARRFEPRSFPLANGVSARVGRLRGYGNAIVPQVAAEFVQACEEAPYI